jgi:hypothetical protein
MKLSSGLFFPQPKLKLPKGGARHASLEDSFVRRSRRLVLHFFINLLWVVFFGAELKSFAGCVNKRQ